MMKLWPRRPTEPVSGPDAPPSHPHDGYMDIDELGNHAAPESLGELMQARESVRAGETPDP